MPKEEQSVEKRRLAFVECVRSDELSIAAACRAFGISRPTGYKILSRFDELGFAGLSDRSRAALHNPRAVSADVAAEIIQFKKDHPTLSPEKIRLRLVSLHPDRAWPSVSTIYRIFAAANIPPPPQVTREVAKRRKGE